MFLQYIFFISWLIFKDPWGSNGMLTIKHNYNIRELLPLVDHRVDDCCCKNELPKQRKYLFFICLPLRHEFWSDKDDWSLCSGDKYSWWIFSLVSLFLLIIKYQRIISIVLNLKFKTITFHHLSNKNRSDVCDLFS